MCKYPVLSVFKKVFGAYFFQTQTKLAVVVTEKPLLGSVKKVLPLPLPLLLLYHLHRAEDDASNRVTFDYCEIVHKNISSSNCVKKDNPGQVNCLKLERDGGGGGVLVNDISQFKLVLRIFKTKDYAALAPIQRYSFLNSYSRRKAFINIR